MPKNTLGFESVGLKLMSMSQTLPANKGLLAQSTTGKKRSVGAVAGVPVVLGNAGLWAWGRATNGKLGLGNATDYSSPKQVGALTTWATVTAGNSFTLAIKTDGTLWAWGYNGADGRLGIGNTTAYSSPKQVGALTNWSKVSNSNESAAIKTDGTLWTWGPNSIGQLGLGNTTSYSSPKQVGALTTWSTVAVGSGSFMLAIKTDGTLWAWGNNAGIGFQYHGMLGLGNTTSYSSPKQVGALTTWSKLSLGAYCSLAIKTDGTLWSWGRGYGGVSGLGNTTSYSSPVQVGALTNWFKLADGGGSAAIKTDGTLWTWGPNGAGRLGLGNTTDYSSPKQVGALTNWSTLKGAPLGNLLAIKTDGTLWTWGTNGSGQLGLGNTTSYSSPKQIGALTTWTTGAQGGNFVFAIAT